MAPPISLATTFGISVDFFSYGYLDVSVLRVRSLFRVTIAGRVSPFGNHGIDVCLPTPPCLSQATTSFIACNRLGIHHMHLFTWLYYFKSLFEFASLSLCWIKISNYRHWIISVRSNHFELSWVSFFALKSNLSLFLYSFSWFLTTLFLSIT